MRLALVMFRGELGGAEIVTGELARALRQQGIDATVVFALTSDALGERLEAAGIPYLELGMALHRQVLYHPRQVARLVAEAGEGAILVECGYLGVALRIGGYRGRIVGVEHGPLLELQSLPLGRKLFIRAARVANAWADDVDVAVSKHMLARLQRAAHAHRVVCIHNGIDLASYDLGTNDANVERIVVGGAGRLVAGKGFDLLLRAFVRLNQEAQDIFLRLAGGGPEFARLTKLVEELDLADKVELLGPVHDMPSFWRSCDIAVTPSDTFPESFSMVTLEAMASGLPVVATNNGGIPELVIDGVTGSIVAPGDDSAIADAVLRYVREPALRIAHGRAARQRCLEHFDITKVAQLYLSLFEGSSTSSAR